jgi:hypothetical protein
MDPRRAAHLGIILILLILLFSQAVLPAAAQADDPNPPEAPVKLVFIHHSTGENWLRDDNGGLGLALAQNNYFVSDTNYGWGPDAIGDRTDIINWPEWFVGPDSQRYMEAVFAESEQHSEYTRLFGDPGGENDVILFKSCFPNSALEGNPTDPPAQSDNLSVGSAKYIYNQLLTYFATRPDKLFIVITAPPLSDQTYADNARAFNTWLVQDWLTENNYQYQNVAVFDFYNVLTGRDNHHRFINGQVEYINDQGKNTSAYASGGGDDHPNQKGNQKAAEEFIPLLNVFYHRWQNSLPASVIDQPQELTPTSASSTSTGSSVSFPIDDFEIGMPAGTNGWEPNWDASTPTKISCAPETTQAHSGSSSLQIDFEIAAESWGTCTLFYDPAQDWTQGSGLTFYYFTSMADLIFDVDLYAGPVDLMETYHFTLTPAPESMDGWVEARIPWIEFTRVDWEENAGAAFDGHDRVIGIGFGLTGSGSIWVDELQLSAGEPSSALEPTTPPAVEQAVETEVVEDVQDPGSTESAGSRGSGSICPSAAAVPAGLVTAAVIAKKKKKSG